MASTARTQFQQSITAPALRSYLAEFISTFLFVFATVGSAMSARKVTLDVTYGAAPLVATALAQGLGLFVAIYLSSDVSGGHVNPAVTFAFTVEGQISILSAIYYCITQMIASCVACLVLRLATAGQVIPTTGIPPEMTGFGGAVIETITTFALVYTALVAGDPRNRKGPMAVAGPLAVGMMTTACVLLAGSFTGASMNPARSFGPAVVSGDFKNQAVYWVGPLVGASLAALVHQNLVFPPTPCPSESTHGVVESVVV